MKFAYFVCFINLFEHVLGGFEFLEMGIVDFRYVLQVSLNFPGVGGNSVADLSADVPGPWEGAGGGYPSPRIQGMGALDESTRPDPQGIGGFVFVFQGAN